MEHLSVDELNASFGNIQGKINAGSASIQALAGSFGSLTSQFLSGEEISCLSEQEQCNYLAEQVASLESIRNFLEDAIHWTREFSTGMELLNQTANRYRKQ